MKRKGCTQEKWVIVNNSRIGGWLLNDTLGDTKKEAITKLIHKHIRVYPTSRYANQSVWITWKEWRKRKSYSVQKVKIKIKFYQ